MATNMGKPWGQDEMERLLSGFRSKKTDAEIAEAHGRTVNSVRFKVLGYACNKVLKEGKTKAEVIEDLGISETDLQKELDKRTMPRPVAKLIENTLKAPSKAPAKAPTKVPAKAPVKGDDLAEIYASVNRLQSLVHRYMNKVAEAK